VSGEFEDDVFGGSGAPTVEQIVKTRDYLKSHNRPFGIRHTHRELQARGFSISLATVQRRLVGIPGGNPPLPKEKSPTNEAERRVKSRRDNAKGNPKNNPKRKDRVPKEPRAPAAPILNKDDVILDDDALLPKVKELLVESTSSTQLAIRENRTRMALNIIIAERMAATPGLLLLDMRGTAALVDALTVAAKLSGGASIDIRIPTMEEIRDAAANLSPNGHQMKDITPAPHSSLTSELEAFRRRRDAIDAKRASN
jgi:hypothetical protein